MFVICYSPSSVIGGLQYTTATLPLTVPSQDGIGGGELCVRLAPQSHKVAIDKNRATNNKSDLFPLALVTCPLVP